MSHGLVGMWHDLLPQDVICEWGDPSEPVAGLFPEEAALLERAVETRRREFAMGRLCARLALAKLGFAAAPLLWGRFREPLWPEGAVGSITHTVGQCAVAVARRDRFAGIGIDMERDGGLPADIIAFVCRPDELAAFETLSFVDVAVAARLAFSAKEAVYKCQFPAMRRMLEFHDLSVILAPDGTFAVQFLGDAPPAPAPAISGRWRRKDGFILTAAWLSR